MRRSVLPFALAALAFGACSPAAPRPARPLRIAYPAGPFSLDPHRHNEAISATILHHLYESLTTFDARLNLVPQLAESWDNPNDLTWRFHLRPDVHWHDGRPFTAADVVFSLDRIRRAGTGQEFQAFLVAVDQVRAIAPLLVEITTRRPYPILLNKLAFVSIVPAGSPDEITSPVGTGPYRFVRRTLGDGIEVEAFPGYWGPRPAETRVELLGMPDPETRRTGLARGDIDIGIDPAGGESAANGHGYRVLAQDSLVVAYLAFSAGTPPFDDRRVRQAVSLALDRELLVRRALRGRGTPLGQMVGRNVFGYVPGLAPPERDVAAARRLLAEAGHPEGIDVTLEARFGRGANEVAQELAEAGIRAQVIERPWKEMYPRVEAGKVPFYLGAFFYPSADASDFFDVIAHTLDRSTGYGSNNTIGFSDPALDRLIETSGMSLDMLSRRVELERCMRRVMEDLPYVPLYAPHSLFGVRDGIRWRPRVDGQILAQEIVRADS